MKKVLLALFLLAAIGGNGQKPDTTAATFGNKILLFNNKYPEELYSFDPVWDRIILMERRLDSLQHRLDSLERLQSWSNLDDRLDLADSLISKSKLSDSVGKSGWIKSKLNKKGGKK